MGVSARDVDRAADLAARGVRVRHGDFTDPESLDDAFEGAEQVMVVSTNELGDAAVSQHIAAIDAAARAGAHRVLYTSHQAAAADSLFAPTRDHAATESYLRESGMPFTALRHGFYASTVPHLLGQALETGLLVAPADGRVSWTAHADLAEAAAVIIADEGRFDGATPPLTAPETVDLEGVAGILSELSGRTIQRVVADDDEWTTQLTAHGAPAHVAQMMLGMFRASRRGEFSTTGPALEDVIGHPATSIRTVLAGVVAPG